MFNDLDTVVLNKDIKKYGLKRGDIGTVVHFYKDGRAIEVEFMAAAGKTMAVLTLSPNDVRSVARNEILHIRDIRGFATI